MMGLWRGTQLRKLYYFNQLLRESYHLKPRNFLQASVPEDSHLSRNLL